MAASNRPTSTRIRCYASTRHRPSRYTWSRARNRRVEWARPALQASFPQSRMRSLPPRESGCARCRSMSTRSSNRYEPNQSEQTRRSDMIRKAKAVCAGSGHLSSESGVLAETAYSFKTRFENEKGTNPEELIAAAHAGCFTMSLAFVLQSAGFTPTELSTDAAVTLEADGKGFRITRSALTLRAT